MFRHMILPLVLRVPRTLAYVNVCRGRALFVLPVYLFKFIFKLLMFNSFFYLPVTVRKGFFAF